ncbi:phage antitermination protein Q [Escherichia coli]|nr:phage antitermination protein Q [Escherichia coli]
MRLESVAKFHSPKSPMMSDSPRATASDSLSGTDVMAAMGMAQSQAGFGMAAFCGKHELSQNDKQKAINYLMQFAHKVSGKYRFALQSLKEILRQRYCKCSQHSLMRIIAVVPRRRAQDAEIATVQAVRLIYQKQSCGGELLRKNAEDAKVSAIQECQQAPHIAL